MLLINDKNRLLLIFFIILIFNGCLSKQPILSKNKSKVNDEKRIVLAMDSLLKAARYQQAYRVGQAFLKRFPESPLIDDVYYRLAYLHIIADGKNPYFDYQQATQAFEQFFKNFPQSNYALACNNWLKVLYLIAQQKKQLKKFKRKMQLLQSQLEFKNKQILQLQNTLRDLEHAIKR